MPLDAKIIVAGDHRLNLMEIPFFSNEDDLRNAYIPASGMTATSRLVTRRGGALLLADFVEYIVDEYVFTHDVSNTERILPRNIPQTFIELALFPRSSASVHSPPVFRVKRVRCLVGEEEIPSLRVLTDHPDKPDLIILYDEGGQFRNNLAIWPKPLVENSHVSLLIVITRAPLTVDHFWERIQGCKATYTIAIVLADDLRAAGAPISRGLSWERTVEDLISYRSSEHGIAHLKQFQHLIVLFGIEGALVLGDEDQQAHLCYDPMVAEGDTQAQYPGKMVGLEHAFVATLGACLLDNVPSRISQGVILGLQNMQRLQQAGFGYDVKHLDYPLSHIFAPEPNLESSAFIDTVPLLSLEGVHVDLWGAVADQSLKVAEKVVRFGAAKGLYGLPSAHFGNHIAIDRDEIEQLRSMKNLFENILLLPAYPARPLSLAVFGPPGAGATFPVSQVARAVAPERMFTLFFNMSQFTSYDELIQAFHMVREEVLQGRLPIIVFDEFDCNNEDRALGWLKYFLAPMQDGTFRDGQKLLAIGRAIFVFRSGRFSTYEEFQKQMTTEPSIFVGAKGPDFIARLRVYFNALGPNSRQEDDRTVYIRRALLLRNMLEQEWPEMFDAQRQPHFDERLLSALLSIPRYKHGVRSIRAILEMSLPPGSDRFMPNMLPSFAALDMHLDAEEFMRLLAARS